MKDGHVVEISETYDFKDARWRIRVALKEFRQGKQYGGTVVWEKALRKGTSPNGAEDAAVKLAKTEALRLITWRIKA